MWDEKFVRLKNEFIEIILTIKQMISNPLMMILHCLWIVITFQEENYINNAKKLAEKDRKNIDHQMPNEFIQGVALTVRKYDHLKIIHFIYFSRTFSLKRVHHH
jgi:plasmid replication initiation protein